MLTMELVAIIVPSVFFLGTMIGLASYAYCKPRESISNQFNI